MIIQKHKNKKFTTEAQSAQRDHFLSLPKQFLKTVHNSFMILKTVPKGKNLCGLCATGIISEPSEITSSVVNKICRFLLPKSLQSISLCPYPLKISI